MLWGRSVKLPGNPPGNSIGTGFGVYGSTQVVKFDAVECIDPFQLHASTGELTGAPANRGENEIAWVMLSFTTRRSLRP
jgi:hypothetical protein